VATGSLELESRELEALSVPVEVSTKRWTGWRWIALALGLLLGSLTPLPGPPVRRHELFEDTWVGTPEQLLVAFLWAYAADVSVDAVLSASRARAPQATAPATATASLA